MHWQQLRKDSDILELLTLFFKVPSQHNIRIKVAKQQRTFQWPKRCTCEILVKAGSPHRTARLMHWLPKAFSTKAFRFHHKKGSKNRNLHQAVIGYVSTSYHGLYLSGVIRSPPSLLRLHHFLSCSQNALACPARWPQKFLEMVLRPPILRSHLIYGLIFV